MVKAISLTNTKLFLVVIAESGNEPFSRRKGFHFSFSDKLKNLELITFSLTTERIFFNLNKDFNIGSVSFALIGIKSIIGYNPYLPLMIEEELYSATENVEAILCDNVACLENYIEEMHNLSENLVFTEYLDTPQYLYLFEDLESRCFNNREVLLKTDLIKNNFSDLFLTKLNDMILGMNNINFDWQTVFFIEECYKALFFENEEKDIKTRFKKVKEFFPNQLKYINSNLLVYLSKKHERENN